MTISQLSIYVENKQGALSEILDFMAECGIDMRAMSIADTADFGILRVIVGNAKEAKAKLEESGYVVSVTDVIGAAIADKPGSLAKVMKIIADNEANVEYMYAFLTKTENNAYVVLRVDDTDAVCDILTKSNIKLLTKKDIEEM